MPHGKEKALLKLPMKIGPVSYTHLDAIAHGSTGAGNDQIRFDMTFLVMAPGVEIITLTRDKALSRKEERCV